MKQAQTNKVTPKAKPAKPKATKCFSGRTEHLMEPQWKGPGFDYFVCRWCGKREAA